MKRIIIISCSILVVANILLGAILTSVDAYNVVISSSIIGVTGLFLCVINTINLKDAYKVSLITLFSILGLLEYVTSFFATERKADNWWLVFVVFVTTFEAVVLIITNIFSNKSGHA